MPSLAALVLATPVFGFALQAPSIQPLLDPGVYAAVADLRVVSAPLMQGAEEAEAGAATADADADAAPAAKSDAKSGAKAEADTYKAEVKRRNALIKIHRPLGIATWATMTVAEVLGFIQYYNLYGFFAGQGTNPCVKGTAVFGQGQCSGTPWPHALSASVAGGLYAATFTVSLMMPDPDDLANTPGAFGNTLRMHKLLRWVHFGGMVAQILLGIVIANANWFGLSRANDYKTLQALATVHLGSGLITYGALTWAGALMTF
ncbi:MAG: hypothetical protein ACHQ53_12730 [Polyangiales bacterium]